MLQIIFSSTLSFLITLLSIPVIIFMSEKKKLYDHPNERKVHSTPVPSLGGVGIFAGFIFTILSSISFKNVTELQYIIAAAIIIFFLGVKDDILGVSPTKKIIGQTAAAFLIIYKGGLRITDMHGFFGLHEIPQIQSMLLTYFTIVVVINAVNLIDGVDGLAGTFGLMATTFLGFYFLKADVLPYSVLSFSFAGSLVGFLFFNFKKAKIFMGDTGSLLTGLLCSVLVLKFLNISASSNGLFVASSPAVGFSILLIPLLDALRVFSVRIKNSRSPFSPDRNHIHHILLDKGFSHQHITLLLVGTNAICIVLAYSFQSLGTTPILLFLIGLYFISVQALTFSKARRVVLRKSAPLLPFSNRGTTKIITLNKESVVEELN